MEQNEDGGGAKVGGAVGEPPGNSTGSMFGAVALGLFTAVLGATFSIAMYNGYVRADESRQWPETPCVVEKAWIEEGRKTLDSALSYRFRIEYGFTFEGKDYTGKNVKKVDGPTSMRSKAEKLLERYPVGLETVCYVDPESPERAILKHDSIAVLYAVLGPGLFVVGGLGIAISGIRGWIRRRRFFSESGVAVAG